MDISALPYLGARMADGHPQTGEFRATRRPKGSVADALSFRMHDGGLSTPMTSVQLVRSAPYFPVVDVEKSVNYYERVLGFRREYSAGVPAQFAIVSRDGLAIMFRLVSTPSSISPNEKQGGTWDVFFWVRDVRGLHTEFCENGAEIAYGPILQESYHMEEFAVRDADGYLLGFGQPPEGGR